MDGQLVIVMAWEDGRLAGVEVAYTVESMAALIAAENFTRRALSGKPIRGRHIAAVAAVFVDHVQRWTLRARTGRPVPVRLDDFLALHKDTVFTLVQQWVRHVTVPPVAAPGAQNDVPQQQPGVAEPAAADVDDIGVQLEARTLHEPMPEEIQVDGPPVLVDA